MSSTHQPLIRCSVAKGDRALNCDLEIIFENASLIIITDFNLENAVVIKKDKEGWSKWLEDKVGPEMIYATIAGFALDPEKLIESIFEYVNEAEGKND